MLLIVYFDRTTMNLKQLQLFLAVADTQSFSKGGVQVSLAQSTTSQHIKALEDELGTRLFDRTPAGIELTSAGRLFYSHADGIMRSCNGAVEAIRRFQGIEEATLRIGASTIPATCIIPDLIGRISKTHPGIRLQVRQGDSEEVIRMLLDNSVELAIVGVKPMQPSLNAKKILTDRIVLVSRADPKTPSPGRLQILPEQLKDCPLLVRETGSGTRKAVDTALQMAGIDISSLTITAQLGSSEALRRGVLHSGNYAFISSLAIEPELLGGAMIEYDVEGLAIKREFYMAWRKHCSCSPAAEVLKSSIAAMERRNL